MVLQPIDEQKTAYFEALVPEGDGDHTLLNVLLDQELDGLRNNKMIGEKSVMHRTDFGSDGKARLDLNIRRGKILDRLSIPVRLCISGVWNGEREDHAVHVVTKHPESNRNVTLYYLLTQLLDAEQRGDDEDDSASDDVSWSS